MSQNKKITIKQPLLGMLELFAITLSFFGITYAYLQELPSDYVLLALAASIGKIILSSSQAIHVGTFKKLLSFFKSWVILWSLLIALLFGLKITDQFSRVVLFSWLAGAVFLFFFLLLTTKIFSKNLKPRSSSKRVIILGDTELSLHAKALLLQHLEYDFEISSLIPRKEVFNSENSKAMNPSLLDRIQQEMGNIIFISGDCFTKEETSLIISHLSNSHLEVHYLPDILKANLEFKKITYTYNIPSINIFESPLNIDKNQLNKRIFDILASTLLITLSSPLLLALAIGVKLSSPGPIIFKQRRVTLYNETFTMYKFRSMPINIDSGTWGKAKEKTNSWFGRLIRKTSLDELPQLFNVLRGDMSLVGPRPEQEKFIGRFQKEIPRYMRKHSVKAGITGWAQVNGLRGDTSLESRIEHDLFYISNWSLGFDIKIILLTVFALITKE